MREDGGVEIRQGRFFRYALPRGWGVLEDGNFAVVLVAPDQVALTIMVGNAGLPLGYNPMQYVYERLAPQFPNLGLGQPQPVQPAMGMQGAWGFELAYNVGGVPCRGVAKCSITSGYDSCTLVITCAAAQEVQWPDYALWLPQIADQIVPTHSAAFGASALMMQSLQNSIALRQQAQEYHQWSQQTWQGVNAHRDQIQEKNNFHFRENLGGVETFVNPYDSKLIELSNQHTYHWVNRQGQVFSTNDPSENPNAGSSEEWRPMTRHKP
ncbi:MAG: hypothetical protein N2318_01485 [Meiothermus sp.]|nr:hypothetical protein [Meiothermus sp.]